MTPQPKTCGECQQVGSSISNDPMITAIQWTIKLCPRHAAADDLYEAAKAAVGAGYCEDTGPFASQDYVSKDAISALRAAIKAYEGNTKGNRSMAIPTLEPYDEINAESVAQIVGEHCATARALALLKERRSHGENVGLFIDNKNKTVVVATIYPMLGESESKPTAG